MPGNKRATGKRLRPLTAKELKKIDDYVLGPKDYEEIPEQTDADFARGVLHIGGVPVRRGRPKLKDAKQAVSLRLDADVVAHFRRTGRGWQSRINLLLRKAAKLPKEKRKRA
jgi:uncharacterized protein (DUF4415 family)